MAQHIKPALFMLLFFTVLTGVAYPLLVTFGAQALFPAPANGSLVVRDQHVVGSALIGQTFTRPDYFWGRPSATALKPYNATASGGSNLGPNNPALVAAVKAQIVALQRVDPDNKTPVPVDLVTASGSGLDPHISPAAADYQVNRIAKLRKIDQTQLRQWVQAHTEARQWGVFGELRVNVLALNLALDTLQIARVGTDDIDFTLPPSKVYIELCQQEVLRLHPGEMGKERMLHRHGGFWMEYELQANDGAGWLVLCDLATGKVTREQKLNDDTP